VNPKQFHYQIEDAIVWLKGEHQLKFGYRLVDRAPSPFTHTDTRSTITFGTSFVNNPVTNAGGTASPRCCSGTSTAPRAAFSESRTH
jgi:hypothetical protein